ncbi:MAG TPA: phage holin family protein [Steroidobacteraceae bacterium]|nr:phage holin family protein [Steroidobacteraceae bacterium]
MNDESQNLFTRGRAMLVEALRMAQTRLELAALEIEQEKLRITRDLRLAIFAAICLWLSGFSLVLWVALALPSQARFILLGCLVVVFLIAALGFWLVLRRSLRRDPPFTRLIGQLRLDRASLGGEP